MFSDYTSSQSTLNWAVNRAAENTINYTVGSFTITTLLYFMQSNIVVLTDHVDMRASCCRENISVLALSRDSPAILQNKWLLKHIYSTIILWGIFLPVSHCLGQVMYWKTSVYASYTAQPCCNPSMPRKLFPFACSRSLDYGGQTCRPFRFWVSTCLVHALL